MKRYALHTCATTGLSLLALALVALAYHARYIEIASVWESFAANAIIHGALLLLRKAEFRRAALVPILDIVCIAAVLFTCGALFKWFASTPVWVLLLMALAIYFLSMALDLVHMRQKADEINALLQMRGREKEADI